MTAIGVLCGVGLITSGITAAVGLSLLLFVLRKIGVDLLPKE